MPLDELATVLPTIGVRDCGSLPQSSLCHVVHGLGNIFMIYCVIFILLPSRDRQMLDIDMGQLFVLESYSSSY